MKIAWIANTLEQKFCIGGTFVSIYYAKALETLGYDVKLLDWSIMGDDYNLLKGFDIVFTVDYGINPAILKKISGIDKAIFYAIDDPELVRTPQKGWDFFATHSRGSVELHNELGRENVFWLPFGYYEPIFHPMESEKILDVVYVGNGISSKSYETILAPIADLAIAGKIDLTIFGLGWNKQNNFKYRRFLKSSLPPEKVGEVYNRSKIVLNMHRESQREVDSSFIMRDFEARGCGAFVLSDSFEGQEYFGENQIFSDSPEDTKELVEYYIDQDKKEERTKISREAYDEIKEDTYQKRAKELLKEIGI